MPVPPALKGIRKALKEIVARCLAVSGATERRRQQLRAYAIEAASYMIAHVEAGILRPEELIAIQCATAILTIETYYPGESGSRLFAAGGDLN